MGLPKGYLVDSLAVALVGSLVGSLEGNQWQVFGSMGVVQGLIWRYTGSSLGGYMGGVLGG